MDVLCKQMKIIFIQDISDSEPRQKPLLMYKVPKFVHNVNYICQNSQMKSSSINNKHIKMKEILPKIYYAMVMKLTMIVSNYFLFLSLDLYG
jgi:hypothetical protein